MIGGDDDVTVTGEEVTPESVLMPVAAVAMRENDEREFTVAHPRVAHRVIQKHFVHLGDRHFVRLLHEGLHFRRWLAGKEIRVLVFCEIARVISGGIPDLGDQRAPLTGQSVGTTLINQDGGCDANRQRSQRGQKIYLSDPSRLKNKRRRETKSSEQRGFTMHSVLLQELTDNGLSRRAVKFSSIVVAGDKRMI